MESTPGFSKWSVNAFLGLSDTSLTSQALTAVFQISEGSQVKTRQGQLHEPANLWEIYKDLMGAVGIDPLDSLIDTLPGKRICNHG